MAAKPANEFLAVKLAIMSGELPAEIEALLLAEERLRAWRKADPHGSARAMVLFNQKRFQVDATSPLLSTRKSLP